MYLKQWLQSAVYQLLEIKLLPSLIFFTGVFAFSWLVCVLHK